MRVWLIITDDKLWGMVDGDEEANIVNIKMNVKSILITLSNFCPEILPLTGIFNHSLHWIQRLQITKWLPKPSSGWKMFW